MTVGSKKLLSMLAQIGRGVRKTDSHLVTDEETSRAWDDLAKSRDKTLTRHPGVGIDIPHDPDY